MAQLKTTLNTLEEKFTTWESKGKKVKPSEITGYRRNEVQAPVRLPTRAS